MLLMLAALVAGQADATIHEAARSDTASAEAKSMEASEAPFRAIINAHIDGNPLMISIDAVAEFNHFRSEIE